eukprot:SAG25_NODE_2265_length_1772_cov_1.119546_3_plen_111_part_00
MLVGNLGGLGFTYLLQHLISLEQFYDSDTKHGVFSPAAWFLVGGVCFSATVILAFDPEYRRLAAERRAAAGGDSPLRSSVGDSSVDDEIKRKLNVHQPTASDGLRASLNR